MFQFKVQLKIGSSSAEEGRGEVTATGFSFRDTSEATESAALAALDVLLYFHGIRTALFNDVCFADLWPSYSELLENFKGTSNVLERLMIEISSLIDRLGESRLLFEAEKSKIDRVPDNSAVFSILDCCQSELDRIYVSFSGSIGEYSEELHRRRSLNWCYSKDYYKGLYALQTELDIKVECISTLKLILNRVWEEVGYCAEPLSFKCTSENCHITELSFIKECGDGDCGERIKISGESCSSIVECQRSAICRAIYSLSVSEGFKIVDPGYLDFRNMKRDSCGLRHVVPALCDVVAKIKSIAQHAFRSIDALGAEYYRQLNNSKFTKELRLSLADCICEFVYTIRSLDKELKKMEIYLSNSVVHGRSTVFL